MRLHSAMVELVFPPIHSQVPSGNPQTEAAELRSPSHKEPVLHLQEDGWASLKIVAKVLWESKIQAKETNNTCKIWDDPN